MKILRIISGVDSKSGGPVEGIHQITPALARLGHTTTVGTLDDPADPWLRENASRYDVVVVSGLWQYTGFGAWQALRDSGTPYFVCAHGMLAP